MNVAIETENDQSRRRRCCGYMRPLSFRSVLSRSESGKGVRVGKEPLCSSHFISISMDCIERIHVQELEDFNSWRSIRSILSIEEYHGGGMVHVLVLESLFVCLSLSSSYCSVCRVWRSES